MGMQKGSKIRSGQERPVRDEHSMSRRLDLATHQNLMRMKEFDSHRACYVS